MKFTKISKIPNTSQVLIIFSLPMHYKTIELLKPCNKGVKMNIWESFFIHNLHKQNLLIQEQKVNNPNLMYELAQDITLRVHN
jgi:hypothetical protein